MCEIVWTKLLNFVYSTLKFPLGYGYVLPFFFAHSTVVPYPDSALTIFDIYFFFLTRFVSLPINFAFPCSSLDLASFIFLPNGKYGYFWFIEYSQFYLQSICRGVFFSRFLFHVFVGFYMSMIYSNCHFTLIFPQMWSQQFS